SNGGKTTVKKFIGLDAEVTSIITPAPDSTYLTCPATGFAPQSIVKNFGPDALSSFNVYLEITLSGTGIVYSEMITDITTLDSGQSRTETFPAAFNPNTVGSYTVKSWISSTSDTNSLNDTAYSAFTATQTNFGGPVFGYYFANSTAGASCAPDQPVYYWEDTTGSTSLILNGANAAGGLLTGNVDDGFFSLGNILGGDYFRYAGVDYDSFYVSTNGIIALTRKNNTTAQLIGTTPLSLPNVNAPRPGIFPFWNDLDYGETRVPVNRLSYKNANGKLIITFDRAPSNNITLSNDYVSFQVILETSPGPTSDGLITVQFNQAGTSAGFLTKYYNRTLTSHTVGIQNNAGNAAIQYRRINLIFVTVDGPLFGSDLALSFGTNDQILPVELSSFVSSVSGNDITLNWTTTSELNNSGFDIERSDVSGQTSNAWTKVGNVQGNGTSSTGSNYSYIDRNLASGNYNYRLKQIDFNGNFEYFNLSNEVNVGVPSNYSLSQNYPNPFNPTTNLEFGISELGFVSLKVFDVSGKEVMTLVNEQKTPGYYKINFNGANLSSGIYFYTIKAGDFTYTKRMILLK
ncbi:MAG: T9SS type A sorting domain-containing protein, partial [Ignavibacteria bacterium]